MQASTLEQRVKKQTLELCGRSAEHISSLPGRPIHSLGQRLSNNIQMSTSVEINLTWAKNSPKMLDVGKGLRLKYKALSATAEQIVAVLLRASLPGETPVQSMWLSVFSTDLLLPAVTSVKFLMSHFLA